MDWGSSVSTFDLLWIYFEVASFCHLSDYELPLSDSKDKPGPQLLLLLSRMCNADVAHFSFILGKRSSTPLSEWIHYLLKWRVLTTQLNRFTPQPPSASTVLNCSQSHDRGPGAPHPNRSSSNDLYGPSRQASSHEGYQPRSRGPSPELSDRTSISSRDWRHESSSDSMALPPLNTRTEWVFNTLLDSVRWFRWLSSSTCFERSAVLRWLKSHVVKRDANCAASIPRRQRGHSERNLPPLRSILGSEFTPSTIHAVPRISAPTQAQAFLSEPVIFSHPRPRYRGLYVWLRSHFVAIALPPPLCCVTSISPSWKSKADWLCRTGQRTQTSWWLQ